MGVIKNLNNMKAALVYIAFYSMIAAAIYLTKSAMPLWALLLSPSITSETTTKD